jgi:hypothetical protein
MQRITPKKLEVIDASSSDSEESSDEGALAPVVFESRLKLLHDKFRCASRTLISNATSYFVYFCEAKITNCSCVA